MHSLSLISNQKVSHRTRFTGDFPEDLNQVIQLETADSVGLSSVKCVENGRP
jgi:hypothetical protein